MIEGVVDWRGWVRVKVATEGTLGGRASSLRECGVEEVACFGLRARQSRDPNPSGTKRPDVSSYQSTPPLTPHTTRMRTPLRPS